jgi:hypothetical protein
VIFIWRNQKGGSPRAGYKLLNPSRPAVSIGVSW